MRISISKNPDAYAFQAKFTPHGKVHQSALMKEQIHSGTLF